MAKKKRKKIKVMPSQFLQKTIAITSKDDANIKGEEWWCWNSSVTD